MNHPSAINLHGVPHKIQPGEAASEHVINFKWYRRKSSGVGAFLRDMDLLEDTINDIRAEIVQTMREDGASWTEIGEAFGISRQGARQRYGGQGIA